MHAEPLDHRISLGESRIGAEADDADSGSASAADVGFRVPDGDRLLPRPTCRALPRDGDQLHAILGVAAEGALTQWEGSASPRVSSVRGAPAGDCV